MASALEAVDGISSSAQSEEFAHPHPTNTVVQNIKDTDHNFVGFLSNYEVYTYLKELKESGTFTGHGSHYHDKLYQIPTNTHMPTLIYESLRYFKSHNSPCMVQSPEIITLFLSKLSVFNLTKAEKLTILNLRPTQPVDIQAIVEESEERLSESEVTDILRIVEACLPEPEQAVTVVVKTEVESE